MAPSLRGSGTMLELSTRQTENSLASAWPVEAARATFSGLQEKGLA